MKSFWLRFAAVWIVLGFIMPHAPSIGAYNYFPFYSWRLFSDRGHYEGFKFSVRVTKCGDKTFPVPVDILERQNFAPGIKKLMVYRRIDGMGLLIITGNLVGAQRILEAIVQKVLNEPEKCEYVVYKYLHDPIDAFHRRPPKDMVLLQEPRFEF